MEVLRSCLVLFFFCLSFVPLAVLAQDAPPDVSRVGVNGVLQWAAKRNFDAANRIASRMPSPNSWAQQVIYSIMPDRFANGNVYNDLLNIPYNQRKFGNTSAPYDLPSYRHGGDLQVIINRLDYLKDLGVTTLWITPVLQNCAGEYHGYCPSDLTRIDVGFGDWNTFAALVNAAHKRGMYVVQDIVINHLCGCGTAYSREPGDHEQCAARLNDQFWQGGSVGDDSVQGDLAFSDSFFPPLKSKYFFNRCGPNSGADTGGTGPAAVMGDFVVTMLDFATYNYDFQNIFTELMKYFIAFADVDGFRLDAAKHVTEDFVAQFSTITRDYARSLGKNNFLVMGEVAAPEDWIGRRLGNQFSDPRNPGTHGDVPASLTTKLFMLKQIYLNNSFAPYPGLNAVYDMDASGTSRDALLGNRPSSDIAKYYDSDYYHTITGEADARLSWVHLEIHDWDRYLNSLCHDGGDDTLKRQDMFAEGPWRLGSAIGSIDNQKYVGVWSPRQTTSDWQNDPFLRRDHDLYIFVRRFVAIRKSCKALTLGSIVWRNAQDSEGGLLIFSRIYQDQEIVVVINPGGATSSGPIPIDGTINYNRAFQKYANLMDAYQTASIGYQNGGAYLFLPNGFSIAAQSTLILVHTQFLGSYNSYLGCNLCTQ